MRFTRWDQVSNTSLSNEVLFLLSEWHLAQINCDQGQPSEVGLLVRNRDVSGLCQYELRYSWVTEAGVEETLTSAEVKHLRQILAFFQKRADIDIGIDTRKVAWDAAVKAEALCKETNEIFRKYFQGGFYFPLDVESVLYRAQRKISTILGDLPSLDALKLRFGPGATTQVKKKDASVRRKLSQVFACSGEAERYVSDLLAEMPLWSGTSPSGDSIVVPVQVHPGRIDFVPKSAKTDRTIAVEPMLNQMVQLGIGDHIAQRLRKEGVDIRDQTRNQRLALEGSLTGALATLDLSSASDTIATGLVESLLPLDWWDFLRSIRTGTSTSPDGVIRLEKFSSMGNGFTFPLETLIFYSLAYACCDSKDHQLISVYGDDIIVPVYAVPLLTKVLTSCGFLLNSKKSYSSGPFRESCGKDYFLGIDVRPCYIKDSLSGHTCFTLHNFYVRDGSLDPANLLLQYIDESLRIWGPDGYGDGHLIGDWSPIPKGRQDGWGGYTFETFTYKSRKAYYKLGADYVFPSYSIYIKDTDSASEFNDVWRSSQRNARLRVSAFGNGSHFLRRPSRWTGSFRPDRLDSTYVLHEGRRVLSDVLPGRHGYKRIKIYVFA